MKNALDSHATKRSNLSPSQNKTLNYYESCLDLDEEMERMGGSPLLDLIGRVGGWRVMDEEPMSKPTVTDRER